MGSCIAYATKKGREFIETTQSEWAGKWDKKVMYYQVIGTCRTLTEKQVKSP
jgi:hypothetical protein